MLCVLRIIACVIDCSVFELLLVFDEFLFEIQINTSIAFDPWTLLALKSNQTPAKRRFPSRLQGGRGLELREHRLRRFARSKVESHVLRTTRTILTKITWFINMLLQDWRNIVGKWSTQVLLPKECSINWTTQHSVANEDALHIKMSWSGTSSHTCHRELLSLANVLGHSACIAGKDVLDSDDCFWIDWTIQMIKNFKRKQNSFFLCQRMIIHLQSRQRRWCSTRFGSRSRCAQFRQLLTTVLLLLKQRNERTKINVNLILFRSLSDSYILTPKKNSSDICKLKTPAHANVEKKCKDLCGLWIWGLLFLTFFTASQVFDSAKCWETLISKNLQTT